MSHASRALAGAHSWGRGKEGQLDEQTVSILRDKGSDGGGCWGPQESTGVSLAWLMEVQGDRSLGAESEIMDGE
jgi:hypothetical protein